MGEATTLVVVMGGALAGGFVSGLAGFGSGLMALGIWLHAVPPAPAAALSVVCSVVAQAGTLPSIWHAIDRARVWPMLAAGLLGVPVGAKLLVFIDPRAFQLGVGALLIGFSAFMLFGRPRRPLAWGGRGADAAVGFLGGVLGGLAGLSGPLPTLWATLRGWGKDARRAVFQVFNLVILAAALASHAVAGRLTPQLGRLMLAALPMTLFGAWLGLRLYRRLSDQRFGELVLGLLGLSGLFLLLGGVR